MRPSILLSGLLFWSCLAAAGLRADEETTPALPLPLPPEAVKLGEAYRAEVAKLSTQLSETVKALPAAYRAKLAALQNELQASGDLDGYLAVTKEIARFAEAVKGEADPFEKVPEMPETALVAQPKKLRDLQDQYLKAYKEIADRRHKQIEDLTNRYIAQLEILQKDLTIQKRIRDAIAIKRETERLRKGVTDDTFVQQALALVAETPAAAGHAATNSVPGAASPVPTFGKTPDWAKWQYDRDGNFAWEGYLFMHPDLPDELSLDFNTRNGRGRIYGRCQVDRMVVDMRERAWFGKAIAWKVKDFATLNATIELQSKEISAGQGYGPEAHLVLLGDKGLLGEGLDVAVMWHEVTLTIAKDPESNRCTLGWPQGKIKKMIDLPATGTVRVLFGMTVRNPGERCETNVIMQ